MSKNPIKKPQAAPSDRELDAALHDVLRKKGMLFPRTEEDLKVIEELVGTSHLFQPDLNRFKALLSEHVAGKSNVLAFKKQEADSEVLADFAQAARNGAGIPDAIKQKMAKNRNKAEALLAERKLRREEKR
jgi:hypothetical protein